MPSEFIFMLTESDAVVEGGNQHFVGGNGNSGCLLREEEVSV